MAKVPLMSDQDVEMGLPAYDDIHDNNSHSKNSRTPNNTSSSNTPGLAELFSKNIKDDDEQSNAVAYANLAIRLGRILFIFKIILII